MSYTWYKEAADKSNWNLADYEKYAQTDLQSRFKPVQTDTQHFGVLPWNKSNFQQTPFGMLSAEDAERVKYLQNQKVMDDWQTAYDTAKQTNLERYDEILKGYGDRYDSAMQGLQGMGDAEKADLQRAYAISGSKQQQGLVNAGLSSTTIRPAVQQQNTSAMQRAMSLVNERLQNQKLGMQNQLSGDKLGFMERREDEYPEMQYYLELLKQHSAS